MNFDTMNVNLVNSGSFSNVKHNSKENVLTVTRSKDGKTFDVHGVSTAEARRLVKADRNGMSFGGALQPLIARDRAQRNL